MSNSKRKEKESSRDPVAADPDQEHEQEEQDQQEAPSGIDQWKLFLIVLVLSTSFSIYLNWSRAQNDNDSGIGMVQKKLDDALHEIELYKKDQQKLGEMFSLQYIVNRAATEEPKVRFSSNDKLSNQYIKIITKVFDEPLPPCKRDIPAGDYDAYRNCFRDLAIETHNALEKAFPGDTQFIVSVGRVHYSFMITTTRSTREEFFITFGDILFEILQYDKVLESNNPNVEVEQNVVESSEKEKAQEQNKKSQKKEKVAEDKKQAQPADKKAQTKDKKNADAKQQKK